MTCPRSQLGNDLCGAGRSLLQLRRALQGRDVNVLREAIHATQYCEVLSRAMGEHNAYGSDACLGGLAEGIMEEIAAATYVVVEELLNYSVKRNMQNLCMIHKLRNDKFHRVTLRP